ncbi:MAG: hypothetical protein IJV89_04120, partial [Lentisphaeria bacterium]|nr:hypothetical protein [Lentisphaeria bacterium]
RFALEPPFPCLVRRSFNEGGTPSILFQNFLCSLFHFALHAKMKKRDICFENEEVQKGNAKTCLHSGKVERLHGNTGGF